MLPASDTAVRPDDERPGSDSKDGFGSTSTSIGPDYPESGWSGRSLARWVRRITGPVIVLCAGTLVVVGVADVHVARDRSGVDRDLATARVAASRVEDHLATGDIQALGGDLKLLARSGTAARTGAVGVGWTVADRADLFGGQVRTLRRDTARIATLAAEARPLRDSLAPLLAPGTDTLAADPDDPNELHALDTLARGLNRYATAAERSADPSAPAMRRAALAAGMLPTLAGSEGPRIWTVCQAATGPCFWTKVSSARAGTPVASVAPGTISPPGRRWAVGVDLLVIGVDLGTLFTQPGAFDAAAAFDLLYHLGSGEGTAKGTVTVRSAVPSEQQAIDRLSHHR